MGLRNRDEGFAEKVEYARVVGVHFKRCNWELLNADIFMFIPEMDQR